MNLALVFLLPVASAEVPAWVAPVVEPTDVVTLYRAFAQGQGRVGADANLACRNFAEDLMLCFRWQDGNRTVRLTDGDLSRLGVSLAQVEARATTLAEAAMTGSRLTKRSVEGVEGSYFVAEVGDGLDAAPFLAPHQLSLVLGARPVLACPSDGAVITWVPGIADLDLVVAVGVRKAHDSASHPVSSRIYAWDGAKWVVWGEAVAPPLP